MNNITPSGESKYSAWAGKKGGTLGDVSSTARQECEEFDLPVYRKHSASRHKRDRDINSGTEDEADGFS